MRFIHIKYLHSIDSNLCRRKDNNGDTALTLTPKFIDDETVRTLIETMYQNLDDCIMCHSEAINETTLPRHDRLFCNDCLSSSYHIQLQLLNHHMTLPVQQFQ